MKRLSAQGATSSTKRLRRIDEKARLSQSWTELQASHFAQNLSSDSFIQSVKFSVDRAFSAIKITSSKLISGDTIEFYYPHAMASSLLCPKLKPFPSSVVETLSTKLGDQHASLSKREQWDISDIEILNEIFFDNLKPRPWFDSDGSFNADPAKGDLRGGLLTPLVDSTRLATVRYFWQDQRCQVDLYLEKAAYVKENDEVKLQKLLL